MSDQLKHMKAVLELPLQERIHLVEAIWDSVAEESEKLALPIDQAEELDRRMEAFQRTPSAGVSWEGN